MDKREELVELSGQVINGMMSADSSIFTKILDRTLNKNVAEISVEIAEKMIKRIDEITENK